MTKFPNYNGIIFEPNFLKYSYKNKISEKPFFLAKKKKTICIHRLPDEWQTISLGVAREDGRFSSSSRV